MRDAELFGDTIRMSALLIGARTELWYSRGLADRFDLPRRVSRSMPLMLRVLRNGDRRDEGFVFGVWHGSLTLDSTALIPSAE